MDKPHAYFNADHVSLQSQPHEDRIAIFAGDAPKQDDETGGTVHSMRFPALLVSEWVSNPEPFAKAVAEVLHENSHRFFGASSRAPAKQE